VQKRTSGIGWNQTIMVFVAAMICSLVIDDVIKAALFKRVGAPA
jgi:hypothetical protein